VIPLFLGLTIANLLALAVAAGVGLAAAGGAQMVSLHRLAGSLAALFCVGAHCVILTYFIATGKWIQHALSVKKLDPTLSATTRRPRAQAFAAAIAAVSIVALTAFFGAAVDNGLAPKFWHFLLALTAWVVNLMAAGVEYQAIRRNAAIIDQILAASMAAQKPGNEGSGNAQFRGG
jgi:hypothetical protein